MDSRHAPLCLPPWVESFEAHVNPFAVSEGKDGAENPPAVANLSIAACSFAGSLASSCLLHCRITDARMKST
jgi:hypothetical protein